MSMRRFLDRLAPVCLRAALLAGVPAAFSPACHAATAAASFEAVARAARTQHPDSAGWPALLRKDLSNAESPAGVWSWSGDVLSATADENIWTKETFAACVIDLEFQLATGTNSGVFVYNSDAKNWISDSIEVQLLDDAFPKWQTKPATWKCGGIFGHLPPRRTAARPLGDWNRLTIVCVGPRLTVLMNGECTADLDLRQWTSAKKDPDGSEIPSWLSKPLAELPHHGRIGLQGRHNDAPVAFRNLRVLRGPAPAL